jgi:TPR repeat protein
LIVDRSGSVVYVSLERSSGVTRQHALQDEAVLRAFRQCRYQVIPQAGRVAPKQVDSRYLWLPRPTPPVAALRKSAEAGDANAQWTLSQMLLPEPDFAAEGSALLEKAASAGNVPAQRELGLRVLDSSTSKADEARAADLIRHAAEAGDPQAMLELARLYRDGRAVEASQAKYIEWLQRAAHDAVPAMRMLGEAYRDGEAVPQDTTSAVRWLSESAQWGDGAALRDMGDLWRKGNGVRADPVLAWMAYRLAESVGLPSGTAARQGMERALQAGDRERGIAAIQNWRVGEALPDALAQTR